MGMIVTAPGKRRMGQCIGIMPIGVVVVFTFGKYYQIDLLVMNQILNEEFVMKGC